MTCRFCGCACGTALVCEKDECVRRHIDGQLAGVDTWPKPGAYLKVNLSSAPGLTREQLEQHSIVAIGVRKPGDPPLPPGVLEVSESEYAAALLRDPVVDMHLLRQLVEPAVVSVAELDALAQETAQALRAKGCGGAFVAVLGKPSDVGTVNWHCRHLASDQRSMVLLAHQVITYLSGWLANVAAAPAPPATSTDQAASNDQSSATGAR